jgi:hypothetical protein
MKHVWTGLILGHKRLTCVKNTISNDRTEVCSLSGHDTVVGQVPTDVSKHTAFIPKVHVERMQYNNSKRHEPLAQRQRPIPQDQPSMLMHVC